jgi:hypothetical protein
MRILSSALLASFLVLGVTAVGHAAPETFLNGQLTLQISTLNPITLPATGAGVSGTVDVSRNGSQQITAVQSFPPAAFSTSGFLVPVTDPLANPIKGVLATVMNASGNFTASGGPSGQFGGQMPLVGKNKVCLFAACDSGFVPANLSVPVTVVGGPPGGTTTVTGYVNVTVGGAPWQTGPLTVDTGMGGTAMVTGSIKSPTSMNPNSHIKLVTPILISTNIAGSDIVPAFGIFNFDVPEPGMLALQGAAVTALVLVGARRLRKRRV